MNNIKLCDATLIGENTWKDLKTKGALGDDFGVQDWYVVLTNEQKELVTLLRNAQQAQGNEYCLYSKRRFPLRVAIRFKMQGYTAPFFGGS